MNIEPETALLIGFLDGSVPLWEVGWMGSSLELSPEATMAALRNLVRSDMVEIVRVTEPDFDIRQTPLPAEEADAVISDPLEWMPLVERQRPVVFWVDLTKVAVGRARTLAAGLPEGHTFPWERGPIP